MRGFDIGFLVLGVGSRHFTGPYWNRFVGFEGLGTHSDCPTLLRIFIIEGFWFVPAGLSFALVQQFSRYVSPALGCNFDF